MSMARPAAEIDPNCRMFSSSRILPGPIRPSSSRSMRRLSVGSDAAADFCMNSGFLVLRTPACHRRLLRTRAAATRSPPGRRPRHEPGPVDLRAGRRLSIAIYTIGYSDKAFGNVMGSANMIHREAVTDHLDHQASEPRFLCACCGGVIESVSDETVPNGLDLKLNLVS